MVKNRTKTAYLLITIFTIVFVGLLLLLFNNIRVNTLSRECDNYKDIQYFRKGIPVVWTAKFDGCLVSCWGASFTRIPSDPKYPRFSGYVRDNGNKIAEEFMQEGQMLKIYGKITDISGSYGSVFNNKCVPTVEIDKIEVVK